MSAAGSPSSESVAGSENPKKRCYFDSSGNGGKNGSIEAKRGEFFRIILEVFPPTATGGSPILSYYVVWECPETTGEMRFREREWLRRREDTSVYLPIPSLSGLKCKLLVRACNSF